MACKPLYLGNPIQTVLRPTPETIAGGFSFLDYDNIIVYLYSSNNKTVKLSTTTQTSNTRLTVLSESELKIEVEGIVTKTMGRGDITFEVYLDEFNPMCDMIGGTPFGICLVDNKINKEVQ